LSQFKENTGQDSYQSSTESSHLKVSLWENSSLW